ncbi:MAG TPA: AsmA-like C-terminal region-containing protein, partial [Cellvibrionaceae bacterium]
GEVAFDQGMLHITEPVVMESPSSQMQISGRMDLLNEQLDTRLVATLPVTGNLTVITALAAGLPAAAGVFLISKIFESEMRKMASVSYTISGDWDEPDVRFDRLFDADPQ